MLLFVVRRHSNRDRHHSHSMEGGHNHATTTHHLSLRRVEIGSELQPGQLRRQLQLQRRLQRGRCAHKQWHKCAI